MRFPDFMVLGAAKAGTTTLCHLLALHPEIGFSTPKEPHHFSFDQAYARGLATYAACFDHVGDARCVGEGSTTYTARRLFPHAAERIAAFDPTLKLIYVAREPLARIESLWMQLRQFSSRCPFRHLGIEELPEAMTVSVSFDESVATRADCLVASTNYWRELAVYRDRFPPEQLLVLLFEDLVDDPAGQLARVYRFLDVDPGFAQTLPAAHLNPSAARRQPRDGLWRLWASPRRRRAYDAVVSRFPQRVRDAFAGLLTESVVERPSWRPETRARVLEQLGDDTARFLEHHGFAPERWRRE